jgi:allophanate hydrolase subunit 2
VSGTIQFPPDGNSLILLAEHQTMGGYTVSVVVIQAGMWKVCQMRPGDSLRFVETPPEDCCLSRSTAKNHSGQKLVLWTLDI